ncbi:hypothetical protein QYF36_015990 [Acer negundo]|nr:hypothetical protein QYF36_015990 [Acer negundo]
MEIVNSYNTLAPHNSDRVRLNVGGKLFETTLSTIQSGGPDSLLYALSNCPTHDVDPIFIDRDPDIFSVFLSLLRSNRLPSTARRFSKQELADEALYYGIDLQLKSAMSPPPLQGIDASIVSTVHPAADALPSAFTAAADDGSIWIAHGGQISVYDWNLSHSSTCRTHLDNITSIRRVWQEVAAIGSETTSGLHFYDLSSSRHMASTYWTDTTDPRIYKAKVIAIADSPETIFASFICPHKENSIILVDKSTLQISSELGRQSGGSTKNMVAEKLTWIPKTGIVLGSAVMSGAFGSSGYIRMWDPRSGDVVWETNEPGSGRSSRFGDSFADVDVDVEGLTLFKVCSKSGDLAMADLRNLGEDPWVYMKDKNPGMGHTGGDWSGNSLIQCYKGQVFVGRGGGLEVWSKTVDNNRDCEISEGLYRRNFVDKLEDCERGLIKKIEGGGDRLFVSRQLVEGIEVWESSSVTAALSAL